MEIISKLYHFGNLSVQRQKHVEYEQKQQKPEYSIVSPSALVGIEVEVENMPHFVHTEYYWNCKQDGSLRNNGLEFTSIPLRGYQVPYALEYLKKQMYENNKPDFSNRCSVHVHLNVRDMTWDQIKCLVILYALFERHFFYIAGTRREESIFCVPLYKTEQLTGILHLENNLYKWQKYNALNLGTLVGTNDMPKYGTVEFRHLYGTDNIDIIVNWINNIMCLREAAKKMSLSKLLEDVYHMNTTSSYIALYSQVFGQYCNERLMMKHDFEQCVSFTKIAIWGNESKPQLNGMSDLGCLHTYGFLASEYAKYLINSAKEDTKKQYQKYIKTPKAMKIIWDEAGGIQDVVPVQVDNDVQAAPVPEPQWENPVPKKKIKVPELAQQLINNLNNDF